MDRDEAVRLALEALKADEPTFNTEPSRVWYKERLMHHGEERSGWLVVFPLDVPRGFEPDEFFVIVYEPDGEIDIPAIL